MRRSAARLTAGSLVAAVLCVATVLACTGDEPVIVAQSSDPDATSLNDAAIDGADAADAAPHPFYVFVTKRTWTGEEVAGISGADGKCQIEAESAGLAGRYAAWLDDRVGSFDTRMERDGGPWQRIDDAVMFADFDRLATDPLVPLLYTAERQRLPSGTHFWTGKSFPDASTSATVVESVDCAGWTSGDAGLLGVYGDPEGTRYDWTFRGRETCDQPRHLVCLRADAYTRKK